MTITPADALAQRRAKFASRGAADTKDVFETARELDQAGVRVAAAAAGSAPVALPALNEDREVRLFATVRAFVNFGTGTGAGTAAATVAATSIPLAADRPELVRVPAGATHFAAIRDGGADGYVYAHAVS